MRNVTKKLIPKLINLAKLGLGKNVLLLSTVTLLLLFLATFGAPVIELPSLPGCLSS